MAWADVTPPTQTFSDAQLALYVFLVSGTGDYLVTGTGEYLIISSGVTWDTVPRPNSSWSNV